MLPCKLLQIWNCEDSGGVIAGKFAGKRHANLQPWPTDNDNVHLLQSSVQLVKHPRLQLTLFEVRIALAEVNLTQSEVSFTQSEADIIHSRRVASVGNENSPNCYTLGHTLWR